MADSCLSKVWSPLLALIHFLHDCLSHCEVITRLPVRVFINKVGFDLTNADHIIRNSSVFRTQSRDSNFDFICCVDPLWTIIPLKFNP